MTFRILAIATLAFPGLLTFASFAQEELDPYEWVIKTYRFPSHELTRGFASEERGALRAPTLPAADAGQEALDDFIKKSSSTTIHFLEMEGLALPKGSLVLFDPETLSLAARLPRIAQSSVSFYSDALLGQAPNYLVVDFALLEGPATKMREIMTKANATANHTAILEELEADGNVTTLRSKRIECRSGQRAKVDLSNYIGKPTDFFLNADNEISYITEEDDYGTSLEIDPVLGADEKTIDLNIAIHFHTAPPASRQETVTFRDETEIAAKVVDTFTARLVSQYTINKGASKLLGIWKPEGLMGEAGQRDVLQAAFVTVDVVKVLPLTNPRLSELLTNRGEAIEPIPEGKVEFKREAEEIPEGMIVRRYVIPPTFLSTMGNRASGGGGAAAADPFAAPVENEPRFTIQATAKNILESAGVPFPVGSSANYLRTNSTLVIRNTPENIELVEAYIMSIQQSVAKSIAVEAHIIQAPGAVLRELRNATRALPNHEPQWQELLARDDVTILNSSWIEARSGQRAQVDSGRNHPYPVGIDLDPLADAKNAKDLQRRDGIAPTFDEASVGVELEVDPVLGADENTIDLNLSLNYDFAPPEQAGKPVAPGENQVTLDGSTTQFHKAEVATQITILGGAIRMISLWQPHGTEDFDGQDILQALFIRPTVVAIEEE